MNLLRSVGAVLAGWITGVALSLLTDDLLRQAGIFPAWGQPVWSTWLNLLALSYRSAFTVIGCYVAGRLSPRNPMLHAMLLGIIGFILSLLGAMAAIQNHFGPAWYPLALALVTLPCAWLGGRLSRSSGASS